MSENDQPQEPLNTRMSDETGGVENQSNARGGATTNDGLRQIHDFGELLNLGELDRYLPVEIQHIMALRYAFKSVMPTFYQMYANAFQDIHVQSSARDNDFKTIPYGTEIYASFPTPLEEILTLLDTKIQQIQASNRMTGFNFETCRGSIQWDPIPPYTSPNEENAW